MNISYLFLDKINKAKPKINKAKPLIHYLLKLRVAGETAYLIQKWRGKNIVNREKKILRKKY
jgi:hypothetical protein